MTARAGYATAPIDLYEKDGAYILEMAVPGFEPKDINVEVSGSTVTISGQRSERTKHDAYRYHRHELRTGGFSRTIVLPQDIDASHVAAKIDKGLLKLDLTPIKPLAAKKIEVTAG